MTGAARTGDDVIGRQTTPADAVHDDARRIIASAPAWPVLRKKTYMLHRRTHVCTPRTLMLFIYAVRLLASLKGVPPRRDALLESIAQRRTDGAHLTYQ